MLKKGFLYKFGNGFHAYVLKRKLREQEIVNGTIN